MTITLPFETLYITFALQQAGFKSFIVGGAVRDLIINYLLEINPALEEPNRLVSDFDFATNATPQEISQIFPQSFYENEFGTVSITHQHLLEQLTQFGFELPDETLQDYWIKSQKTDANRIIDIAQATKIHHSLQKKDVIEKQELIKTKNLPPFEITTFRSDGVYDDFRRPTEVSWGKSIEDDVSRRDFTVNAMAIEINQKLVSKFFVNSNLAQLPSQIKLSSDQYQLIDQFEGMKDLSKQLIRTVGSPNSRFQEDALRMLRAIRFSVQLGYIVETNTLLAIQNNSDLIKHVSWERIRDEFLKILASPAPDEAIMLLEKTGLLAHILPELLEAKGVEQGRHHNTNVWTHSLDALKTCPSKDPVVRLATLLHDIGKPSTVGKHDGEITFYNHEIISSRIASKVAKRLKLSKKDVQRVFTLTRYHMFYYQPNHSDASIRRFMKNVGLENIDDILDLREGDRLGSGAKKTSWRLEEMKQRMIDQLHQPMDVTDLAINGHDLMKELNLKPGPILGKTLNELFEMVMEDPEKNTKEILLEEAKQIIAKYD